jgi:hypothetical protein
MAPAALTNVMRQFMGAAKREQGAAATVEERISPQEGLDSFTRISDGPGNSK